ncbi:MAG: hypothetical protein B6I24_09530 [Bacteroidetes bacterium 4572_128]|nr:MAG: hypothetical protein B6I24_09530 [Bacteroidetes bacterium 4572_128]
MKNLKDIDKVLKNLGFLDIYEFAEIQIIKILEKEIEITGQIVEKFEKKYKMKLEELKINFYKINKFSIIEKDMTKWIGKLI